MITLASQRIQSHLNELLKEKSQLDKQIKNLQDKDKRLNSEMHRIEFKILTDSQHTNVNQNVSMLVHEMNILKHDRHDLHEDERSLKLLITKINEVTKKITTTQFWMKHANSDDSLKQAGALKHVFG